MKLGSRHFSIGLGLLTSAVALLWLAQQFDFVDFSESLRNLEPVILAPVPMLILASFCIRAQRWRLLIEHQPPVRYWPSFCALMIGYLLNNLLPARAGDVARALELGRAEKMSRTKVLATLVTERTVDLVATLAILSLVLLSYPALPTWLKKAGFGVLFAASAAMILLILAHTTGRRWVFPLVSLVTRRLPESIAKKSRQMVVSALDGVAGMFRPAHAVGFISLTGLLWLFEVGIVYLVATAVGLPLALGNALFVLLVLAIGSMVPSSPGFVGTYEFFGISALALLDIQGGHALAFVVLLHIVTLSGSTFLGMLCLLFRPMNTAETTEDIVR